MENTMMGQIYHFGPKAGSGESRRGSSSHLYSFILKCLKTGVIFGENMSSNGAPVTAAGVVTSGSPARRSCRGCSVPVGPCAEQTRCSLTSQRPQQRGGPGRVPAAAAEPPRSAPESHLVPALIAVHQVDGALHARKVNRITARGMARLSMSQFVFLTMRLEMKRRSSGVRC